MIQRTATPLGDTDVTVAPIEAAWLTDLSAKAVHATIDRGELRLPNRRRSVSARRSRRLGTAELLYLLMRKELSDVLSASAKRELHRQLAELVRRDGLRVGEEQDPEQALDLELADGLVRIDLLPAWRRLSERWAALRRAADVVVSDPEIRGGEPVIRGTRIPVYLIAELVDQGADIREILEDYPALSQAKVQCALAFVRTHPRRGRPRRAPWRE